MIAGPEPDIIIMMIQKKEEKKEQMNDIQAEVNEEWIVTISLPEERSGSLVSFTELK